MLRLSANLSFLFQEIPFQDRFAAARALGFKGVEYMSPFDYPADEIAALLGETSLKQVMFNAPMGSAEDGERGIACLPGREEEFAAGIETAIQYAGRLGCGRIHVMAGIMPFGASRIEYERAYRSNIALAADLCIDAGIAVLVEPINQIDMPGYFLRDTRQAIAVIEDLSRPNLMLQYDIYHAQMTEGHITRTLREHLPVIGHIQIASPPDRTEPGTGEVDYDFLFEYLHSAGYEGWIGCEYRPSHGTVDSLAWARAYGIG